MRLTNFGKEVRRIRLDADHRLKDMAEVLNVSAAFLSAIETGRKQPPPRIIDEIVRHYGLDQVAELSLQSALAETRRDFNITLTEHASFNQKMAAAALARKFSGLSDTGARQIVRILDKEAKGNGDRSS